MQTLITIGIIAALFAGGFILISEWGPKKVLRQIIEVKYEEYYIDKHGIVTYINPQITYHS